MKGVVSSTGDLYSRSSLVLIVWPAGVATHSPRADTDNSWRQGRQQQERQRERERERERQRETGRDRERERGNAGDREMGLASWAKSQRDLGALPHLHHGPDANSGFQLWPGPPVPYLACCQLFERCRHFSSGQGPARCCGQRCSDTRRRCAW